MNVPELLIESYALHPLSVSVPNQTQPQNVICLIFSRRASLLRLVLIRPLSLTVVTAILSLGHHVDDNDGDEWDLSVFLIIGLY